MPVVAVHQGLSVCDADRRKSRPVSLSSLRAVPAGTAWTSEPDVAVSCDALHDDEHQSGSKDSLSSLRAVPAGTAWTFKDGCRLSPFTQDCRCATPIGGKPGQSLSLL